MIHDLLENSANYECLHPRFKQAFDFLKTVDLSKLPLGVVELDGKNLFFNLQEVEGKTIKTARMETHDRYIDIQIPISGTELMGWTARKNLKQMTEKYDAEKDITFYADEAAYTIKAQPSEFVIFFPEDGHQPGIGDGKWKKIVFKVKVI